MTFGETLQAWREYRGLTRAQVYHASGISVAEITRIERCALAAAILVWDAYRLAQAVGATVEQLCTGIGPRGDDTPC
jgi:transcriptional regulator with XRE-family HTH domain